MVSPSSTGLIHYWTNNTIGNNFMTDLVGGINLVPTNANLIWNSSYPFISSGRQVIMASISGSNKVGLYLNNNILTFYDSSGTTITGGSAINNEIWHHIAVSYNNNGTTILYVDGVAVYTGTCHINSFSGLFYLGGYQDSSGNISQTLPCSYNDLRIWNYARTATEILTYYKIRVLPTTTGLVHNWLCSNTSNVYLTDISGGFNLTSTGGMFWNSSGPTIYSQYYDGVGNIVNTKGEDGGVGSLNIQFY